MYFRFYFLQFSFKTQTLYKKRAEKINAAQETQTNVKKRFKYW